MNYSLCYIEKENQLLMLHRNKKKEDINKGKWIGLGGKFMPKESPEECMIREVLEESGLIVKSYSYRGFLTFAFDDSTEYGHLFTVSEFEGQISECDEGHLQWIDKNKIDELNLWQGDRFFLDLMLKDTPFFSMKLEYKNDDLVMVKLNGEIIYGN